MSARKRGHKTLSVDGNGVGATPQRMGCHQRDIQAPLRERRRDLVVVQLMKGKNHVGMLIAPGRQQGPQRLPNRRHPDPQSNMPRLAGPTALSNLQHGIDVIENSSGRGYNPPAGLRKTNPKSPPL